MAPVQLEDQSQLSVNEPKFAQYWFDQHAETRDRDPQFGRWIDYEGHQLGLARETVASLVAGHFPVDGRRVLDLGSQWGATTVALSASGADVVGIDISPDLAVGSRIRATEQGQQAEFVTGRAESLPFATASFDVVVCLNVIEHVKSHTGTIREIARVLRPGGDLYLDGPNRLSPYGFRRDPHFRMIGISVLPEWLARLYVTKVRHYPEFGVGTFPIASVVERKMLQHGLELVETSQPGASKRDIARYNLREMFWIHGRRQA